MPDIVTRMVLRGWGVRVVVVSAVAVLAAGCTGDPEPVVTTTIAEPVVESLEPSPSPTPSPSPSPTELTKEQVLAALPSEGGHEDFWGAQEFARYFLENYHQMIEEEPELFTALSGEDCVFCARTSEFFEQAKALDHSVEGGKVTVTGQLAQGGQQEDGTWGVIFDVDADPLVERDPSGRVVSEDAGGPGVATLLLEFDGHWSVLEVAAEAE